MGKEQEGTPQKPFIFILGKGNRARHDGEPISLITKNHIKQKAQKTAIKHKERQLWVVTRAYGDNYYDIQKGSTLVLDFDFNTGKLAPVANGNYTNETVTKHSRVFNATGLKLQLGTTCLIDYRDDNVYQKPYIRSAVSMPFGQETSVLTTLVPGTWDQTWANFFWNATSKTSVANYLNYPGTDCLAYDTDTLNPGFYWDPSGLLYRKTGHMWLVNNYTNLAEDFDIHEIRVQILLPRDLGTFGGEGQVFLPLTGTDRDPNHLYFHDGTCFYNNDDDKLTVLGRVYPGDVSGGDDLAKIWTISAAEDLSLSYVENQVTVGTNRGFHKASFAGRYGCRIDGVTNTVYGYHMNPNNEYKWEDAWTKNSDVLGKSIYHPDQSTVQESGRNFGPIWSGGYFYTLSGGQEGTNPTQNAFVKEIGFNQASGAGSDTVLYEKTSLHVSEIPRLNTAIEAWADSVLAFHQGIGDLDFPSTGTEETITTDYTIGEGESWEFTYTSVLVKTWHGVLYDYVSYTLLRELQEDPYPYTNYEHELTFPDPFTIETGNVDIFRPPIGMPLRMPNRNGSANRDPGKPEERMFWTGNDGLPLGSSQFDYKEDACRGVVLPDGSRLWCNLKPFPLYVPGGPTFETDRDSFRCIVGTVPCGEGSPITVCSYPGGTSPEVFLGGPTFPTPSLDRKALTGVTPLIRYAHETVLYKVANGGASSTVISSSFTNVSAYGVTNPESLPVPENVYQVVYVERFNQIAVLMDERPTFAAQPRPCVKFYNATTLGHVGTIAADKFYPSVCLETFTSNQSYEDEFEGTITYAFTGDFKYSLWGMGEIGPMMKLLERENDSILIVGIEAYELMSPTEITPEGSTTETFELIDSENGEGVFFTLDAPGAFSATGIISVYIDVPENAVTYTFHLQDQQVELPVDAPLEEGQVLFVEYNYGTISPGVGDVVSQVSWIKLEENEFSSLDIHAPIYHVHSYEYGQNIRSKEDGPSIVRNMAIGTDRVVWSYENAGQPTLRQVY